MTEGKHINDIRKHVENGDLSLIVGAGFSKNISNKFPLWDELLEPMIQEMYPELLSSNPNKKQAEKNIINQKGYLNIASEYVQRKGYHEVIDVYIEKHMPYLVKQTDGSFNVMLNGKCIDANPSLECHSKLISLDIKNIYTFNYDNALDLIGETEIAEQSNLEQSDAMILKSTYESQKSDYLEKYSRLKEELENRNITSEISAKRDNLDSLLKEINNSRKQSKIQLDEINSNNNIEETLKANIAIFDKAIEEQEMVIRSAESKQHDVYQLIKNDFQISLTERRKNIYKLHGNLRSLDSEEFGFDHDNHKQYIICKEDYEEYPKKHDAFVNLMKISLLKGAFCLIGFSGDDPNFLMWISWVKDVLDKSKKEYGERNSNPIFFINLDDNPIQAEKLLLLRNNYITPVNLAQLLPDAKTTKERMSSFLDKIVPDKLKYEEYERSWNKIDANIINEATIEPVLSYINNAYNLAKYNRIPIQTYLSHYKRTNVFSNTSKLIKNKKYISSVAKLIYAAIKGELVPIDMVFKDSEIHELLSQVDSSIKIQYYQLVQRSHILQNKRTKLSKTIKYKEQTDDISYELILNKLFTLRFSQAKEMLRKWEPQDSFCKARKLMLLSIFEQDNSFKVEVHSLLNPDKFNCLQDYKIVLDLLPQIRGIIYEEDMGISLDKDYRPDKKILNQNNPNLIEIGQTIDRLIEDIDHIKDIRSYGNINHSIKFETYNLSLVNSIKILQIFIEIGLPTETRHISFLEKKKWMIVCKNIYERYPYPSLYFTLLYGNSKEVIKKISQDYIYSTKLNSQLPDIINNMLLACKDNDCPQNIKDALYIAIPIFMRAVAPQKWSQIFEEIFNDYSFNNTTPNRDRISPVYDFLIEGVKLTHNSSFKQKVLLNALSIQSDIDNFYNELIIAATTNFKDFNEDIRKHTYNLMKIAQNPPQFYVLLNLKDILDKGDLCNKFLSLSDEKYKDITLLSGVSWFAREFPALQSKLRNIVINSHLLWLTGIGDDHRSFSHYGYTLDINYIQKNIKFNKDQIYDIYTKMLTALDAISDIKEKWSGAKSNIFFNDWRFITKIMLEFLTFNKNILHKIPTYLDTKKKTLRLYYNDCGDTKISKILVNDNNTNKAIESLVYAIEEKGVTNFQHEYLIIANKIIMHNSQYLNSCFKHLGWVLTTYENQFDRTIFKPLIRSILDSYEPYFLKKRPKKWDIEYAEKDVVEGELIKIYNTYALWQGKSQFWRKYTPIYYN